MAKVRTATRMVGRVAPRGGKKRRPAPEGEAGAAAATETWAKGPFVRTPDHRMQLMNGIVCQSMTYALAKIVMSA